MFRLCFIFSHLPAKFADHRSCSFQDLAIFKQNKQNQFFFILRATKSFKDNLK